MRKAIDYCAERANEAEVADHLSRCDKTFVPLLSSRVDLVTYAHKITDRAKRFEAWVDGELVGLLAAYCNAPGKRSAFITSVSVLPGWKGNGIASKLLENCIDHVRCLDFGRIELEVGEDNESAIALYAKHGFKTLGQQGSMLKMSLAL